MVKQWDARPKVEPTFGLKKTIGNMSGKVPPVVQYGFQYGGRTDPDAVPY